MLLANPATSSMTESLRRGSIGVGDLMSESASVRMSYGRERIFVMATGLNFDLLVRNLAIWGSLFLVASAVILFALVFLYRRLLDAWATPPPDDGDAT